MSRSAMSTQQFLHMLTQAVEQAEAELSRQGRRTHLRISPVVLDPRQPGDWLALTILRLTGLSVDQRTNCNNMRERMNAWGWAGCWARRDALIDYLLREQPHQQGPRTPTHRELARSLRELLAEARRHGVEIGLLDRWRFVASTARKMSRATGAERGKI